MYRAAVSQWFLDDSEDESTMNQGYYTSPTSSSDDGTYDEASVPRTMPYSRSLSYPATSGYQHQTQPQHATTTGQWPYSMPTATHSNLYSVYSGAYGQYQSYPTANHRTAMLPANEYEAYAPSPVTTQWTQEQIAAYAHLYPPPSSMFGGSAPANNPQSISYLINTTAASSSPSTLSYLDQGASSSPIAHNSPADGDDDEGYDDYGDDEDVAATATTTTTTTASASTSAARPLRSTSESSDPVSESTIPPPRTSTVDHKQIFACPWVGCTSRSNRKADYQRHYVCVHARHLIQLHECPVRNCHRVGMSGFTRKDHLIEHLRSFHAREIPKRKGGSAAAASM